VDSFVKKSSYIYYTQDALKDAAQDILLIAEREDLAAHANAVRIRVEESGGGNYV
jgi:histidinol dehydrogenase